MTPLFPGFRNAAVSSGHHARTIEYVLRLHLEEFHKTGPVLSMTTLYDPQQAVTTVVLKKIGLSASAVERFSIEDVELAVLSHGQAAALVIQRFTAAAAKFMPTQITIGQSKPVAPQPAKPKGKRLISFEDGSPDDEQDGPHKD
jgi:hypothetical protein